MNPENEAGKPERHAATGKRGRRWRWFMLGVLATIVGEIVILLVLRIDVARRPPAPTEGEDVPYPWGAIELSEIPSSGQDGIERSLAESFRQERPGAFDPDQDGSKEYAFLALSGGGSNGAFGAGLLNGWTAHGDRPDFKVVTGVSTGALQATFAFLGPEYDEPLRDIYTKYDTDHIYENRPMLAALFNDALTDTSPLKRLVDRYINAELLKAVAEKYNRGHRLYVGTTNMDTREFIIWDLGKIAASGRPDAVELYGNVLLASASIPVLMPPVYFQVNREGPPQYEMHADGGTYAQVFFRGFLLDFDDACDVALGNESGTEMELFVIRNGAINPGRSRSNVSPRVAGIATVTIENLFDITINAALYRIYVLANRYGIDFNLAQIPADRNPHLEALDFDLVTMKQLYDLGFEMAEKGYKWEKHPAGLDPDELFE